MERDELKKESAELAALVAKQTKMKVALFTWDEPTRRFCSTGTIENETLRPLLRYWLGDFNEASRAENPEAAGAVSRVLDDLGRAEADRNAAREVIVRIASRVGVAQEDFQRGWDHLFSKTLEAVAGLSNAHADLAEIVRRRA